MSLMPEAPRITVDELKRRMDAGEDFTVLIHVLNPQAWGQSNTMIPEAIRVPLDDFERHLFAIPQGSSHRRLLHLTDKDQAPVWRNN